MSLLIKRIGLIVVSMILGAVITWAIITFLLGTSIAEFGSVYFPLTSFFIGVSIVLIADRWTGTELLPK